MQVPRHWRMKQQLYRLNGVRYSDGNTDFLNRPGVVSNTTEKTNNREDSAVSVQKPAVRVA